MRRTDKEIANREGIEDILRRGRVCHLGLCDKDVPYVVPMNYGYRGNSLYLHSSSEGRKIDLIRRNNRAAFCIYIDAEPVSGEAACKWTMKYRSVMGEGKITLIERAVEKEVALQAIMLQQAGPGEYSFERASVDKIAILRLDIEKISGKKSGYPD